MSDEGDTYVADHAVRFTAILGASGEVTKLFNVDDYTSAQATDQKMVDIYKVLSGAADKPDQLNTEGFQVCDEGYLLRYDRSIGQWATVVPTKKAQATLVRDMHLATGDHPHAKKQVYDMRHICWWRGMAKQVTEFERRCERHAWKSSVVAGPWWLLCRPGMGLHVFKRT